jgi:hypothetical protein
MATTTRSVRTPQSGSVATFVAGVYEYRATRRRDGKAPRPRHDGNRLHPKNRPPVFLFVRSTKGEPQSGHDANAMATKAYSARLGQLADESPSRF